MKSKRMLSVMLAIVLVLCMAVPALATDEVIIPRGEVHCQRNGTFGVIFRDTTIIRDGSVTRNCTHGRVGRLDERVQYHESVSERCNLCDYRNTYAMPAYYSGWNCI